MISVLVDLKCDNPLCYYHKRPASVEAVAGYAECPECHKRYSLQEIHYKQLQADLVFDRATGEGRR